MPKNMSGGRKRRLDIDAGLIHDPTLVFLDEPTTGLDPQARANLWKHIARLRTERGARVFLTTHYLDEADVLSDRIVIIDQGRIVASDTADNLKAQLPGDLVDLEAAADHQLAVARDKLASIAAQVEVEGRHVRGRVQPAGRMDDVFLSLTGRSLRDPESAADAHDDPELEGASACSLVTECYVGLAGA
jgi:ABC-2 type transport system ATP-binding protein